MYVYRNSNTGDTYEAAQRSVRLDHLPNWLLIDAQEEPAAQDPGPRARPSRPLDTDSKAVWVDYAVSRGMAESDARALSKASLVTEFGQEDNDGES